MPDRRADTRLDHMSLIPRRFASPPRADTARGGGLRQAGLAAGLLLIAATLPSCRPEVELERIGEPARPFVVAEVPGDIAQVTAALRDFFNDGYAPIETPNRFPRDDFLSRFKLVPAVAPAGSQHASLPNEPSLHKGSPD